MGAMRIAARDFRGLVALDAEWDGVLLIAGRNGSAKSSVCTALAAAASGVLLPFEGVTKAKASLLVRDGAEDAVVSIAQPDGIAFVNWPQVARRSEGQFRDASSGAVGLTSPLDLSPRERAGWLIEMLGASPDEAALRRALGEAEVPAELIAEAWESVTKLGWDGAHAAARETGARIKGAWERVTGARYGSQKALTWRPEDWRLEYETIDEALLIDTAARHQEALEAERGQGAVRQADYEQLKAQADRFGDLDCAVIQADQLVRRMQEEVNTARQKRDVLGQPASADDTTPCPHCGKQVLIVGKLLKAPNEGQSRDAVNQLRREIAAADGHRDNREAALRQAEMAALQTKNQLAAATAAKARIEAMPAAGNAERLAGLQTAFEAAANAVALVRCWREANRLRVLVEHRAAIVKLLAEDGLRQRVLADRIAEFNQRWLTPICQGAGWAPVAIGADLALSFGGRPYPLISASEQFRVRCSIQIAAAQLRGEPLVIIDGADMLDRDGRNGLFYLLSSMSIPSVVGMTILKREEMPDLGAAGIGQSVWIEAGLPEPRQAVAA